MRHPEKLIQPPNRLRDEDVLYFLHIPKTAGTTVAHLLESHFPQRLICPVHLVKELARLPHAQLQPYRFFWGHFGYRLTEFVPNEMIFITFLREPVEQVVSFYQFIRRNPQHYLHARASSDWPTLDQFVHDPAAIPHIRNPQLFHFLWDARLIEGVPTGIGAEDIRYMETVEAQMRAIPEHEQLERAGARLDRFAFVGLTERMEESLRLLAFTFGWKEFDSVPHLNTAPRRLSAEELSGETLAAIRELTRLDAELYTHAKELFTERLQIMRRSRSLLRGILRAAHGSSNNRSQVLP